MSTRSIIVAALLSTFTFTLLTTQAFTTTTSPVSFIKQVSAATATAATADDDTTCLNRNAIPSTTTTTTTTTDSSTSSMRRTMTRLASARVIPESKLYVSEPPPQCKSLVLSLSLWPSRRVHVSFHSLLVFSPPFILLWSISLSSPLFFSLGFGNSGNTPDDPAWTNANWLKSRFHFSFAEYNNRGNSNFGVMRVCNDDLVQPHRGFGTHPHRDMVRTFT